MAETTPIAPIQPENLTPGPHLRSLPRRTTSTTHQEKMPGTFCDSWVGPRNGARLNSFDPIDAKKNGLKTHGRGVIQLERCLAQLRARQGNFLFANPLRPMLSPYPSDFSSAPSLAWRRCVALTLIVAACVLGLVGCKEKSLNQVSLEAAKHLAEYKELVTAFSKIQNLKSAGDNVNGYWKTRGNFWSKDADATSSISFDELCRVQGLKAEDIKSLQRKLDASGVIGISRKGSEIYLLIARSGFAHPGGTAFYVVWSNNSPDELYGESKKIAGESNWWVMEVR